MDVAAIGGGNGSGIKYATVTENLNESQRHKTELLIFYVLNLWCAVK